MEIKSNFSLKPYNTFALESFAKEFVEVKTLAQLRSLFSSRKEIDKLLILGGGSNILLGEYFDGLVIQNSIKGIEVIKETDEEIWVEVGAGENWHDWVMFCVQKNWPGFENLSLIPGTVGAAPMQNIGAYGVEVKEFIELVKFIYLPDLSKRELNKEQCNFGYRESVFKHDLKDKVFIYSVVFKINKNRNLNLSYGDINKVLSEHGVEDPSIKDVSDAVISIRKSKLPDPKELGNSGSFFKNPEISKSQFDQLKAEFSEMPGYELGDGRVKVPAGWLIEKAGWKGKRVGNTGSHAKQALVLVNYGNANGEEIKNLAFEIINDIEARFGIRLNPEVNFIF